MMIEDINATMLRDLLADAEGPDHRAMDRACETLAHLSDEIALYACERADEAWRLRYLIACYCPAGCGDEEDALAELAAQRDRLARDHGPLRTLVDLVSRRQP